MLDDSDLHAILRFSPLWIPLHQFHTFKTVHLSSLNLISKNNFLCVYLIRIWKSFRFTWFSLHLGSNECLNFYLKEAYEEFKHILLALVYDEEDKNSPVVSEVRGYFIGPE